MAVMWAQLNSPPPRLTSFRPDLPPAVDQVMARALAKSPAGRYPSCLAFSAALQDACGAAPGPPAGTAGPVPPPRAARPAPATAADPAAPPAPPPARPPAPARPPTTPLPVLRSFSQRADPPSRPGAGRRRRGVAAIVACLVILAAACAGYAIMRNSSFLTGTPAAAGSSLRTGAGRAAQPGTPAGTVQAYYTAISHHEYRRAWDLGGKNSGAGHTFSQFAAGFSTTRTDTVTILGHAGTVVSARLAAVQTDGTVRHFLGKYLVRGGVIITFQVVQTS